MDSHKSQDNERFQPWGGQFVAVPVVDGDGQERAWSTVVLDRVRRGEVEEVRSLEVGRFSGAVDAGFYAEEIEGLSKVFAYRGGVLSQMELLARENGLDGVWRSVDVDRLAEYRQGLGVDVARYECEGLLAEGWWAEHGQDILGLPYLQVQDSEPVLVSAYVPDFFYGPDSAYSGVRMEDDRARKDWFSRGLPGTSVDVVPVRDDQSPAKVTLALQRCEYKLGAFGQNESERTRVPVARFDSYADALVEMQEFCRLRDEVSLDEAVKRATSVGVRQGLVDLAAVEKGLLGRAVSVESAVDISH